MKAISQHKTSFERHHIPHFQVTGKRERSACQNVLVAYTAVEDELSLPMQLAGTTGKSAAPSTFVRELANWNMSLTRLFASRCIMKSLQPWMVWRFESEAEDAPIFTRSISIQDLGTDQFELTDSIQVEIESYPDEIISKVPELDLWVSEPTQSLAIAAVKHEILDFWEELNCIEDSELGKLPRMWKRILNKKIRTRVSP